jgi:tetratricopeptide (TPR) repeat protein
MEIPNAALRTQADSAMTKGQSDIRSGKLKPGLEQLKDALELYRSMPPGSAFARSSRDRAETLRKLLLDSYRKQAEALMNQEHPPWDDAKDLLGEARRYAEALDERRPIDEKTGVCEINRRDESSLLAATEIVQRNDRPQFAHAKELVESVASTSRCYKDAVAYKNWFKADGLVCGAIRDFDQGQYEVAKGLIGAAARVPDLRPEVIVSLQNMLGLWARIDEAWRTGYDAEQKSDYAHAREQFKTVVGLAPNPANWYRQHAEKELAIVEEDRQSGIDAALRQGVELLDAGKYAEASEKLSQAIAGGGAPCRTQVEDAVARVNKAKGLLKEANRIVVGIKTDRYPWARTVLQLLATYLASNDPDHEAAVQLLARLK